MARFCNKCNYPIEDGGVYCSECGSSDIRDTSNLAAVAEESTTPEEEVSSNSLKPVANSMDTPMGIPEMVPGVDASNSIPLPLSAHRPMVDINQKEEKPDPVNPPKGFEVTDNHDEEKNSFADVPIYMNQEEPANQNNVKPNPVMTGSSNDGIAAKRNMARRKNDKSKTTIIVVVAIIVVSLLSGLAFLYFYGKDGAGENGTAVIDGPFKASDMTASGNPTPSIDYSTIFTPQNSFRVGSDSYGYISIPNTWVKFADVDGNTTLQYTDNSTWIVTIYAIPTASISAVDWANNVYVNLEKAGATNITTSISTINSYTALTISSYYPEQAKYLTTWFLESKSGKTHYLAIEGPANTGDNYNIIYSFRENS